MEYNEWKKRREDISYNGYRKIITRVFQLPDGSIAEFDIKYEGPAVCVLALTKDQKVVLAKQFRPGPERILFELPGGACDGDEPSEQAMARELLEETGYSGEFRLVATSFACAYSTRIKYNFVALNCHKQQDQRQGEHEFIEVVEMPLEDFLKLIRSGELTDLETAYLGLDALGLLSRT